MANWDMLKKAISDVIKTNGNQEITGLVLQNVLLSIISNLGNNIMYAGEAIPTTNPGTPDGPVFYFAFEPGTYVNFSGIVVTGEALMLTWNNNTWSSRPLGFASANYVREEFAKTPYISNTPDTDFDLADENGNVIMRLKDGHIQVKNFNSRYTLSNENLQIHTELSDDETGNRELRLYITGYDSKGISHKYGPYSLPYATEESEGTMSAEDKRHLEKLNTSDTQDADFDLADENGNVIMRLKDGHIQVKNFNSRYTLSNENLQIHTELSDDETGNRELRLYITGYDSKGISHKYGPYSLPYATEESEGTMSAEDKRHLEKLNTSDTQDADFDLADENGNVIMRLKDGHIQVKNFNSKVNGQISIIDNSEEPELQIADENGNVIAEFKNGHFRTKNFNSATDNGNVSVIDDNYTDFDLADENGNVIMRLKNGHVYTKNFNSESMNPSQSILSGKKISFLGDSITEHGYYINSLVALCNIIAIRYGISGTTLAAKSSTDSQCFENRVSSMTSNTDVVVVMGGTNDFGHISGFASDYAFGSFEDFISNKYTFCAGVHRLFKKLYDKFEKNGVPVIIVTPLHIGSSSRYVGQINMEYTYNSDGSLNEGKNNVTNKTFLEYVNVILQIASYYSLKTIDLYRESGMNPYLVPTLFSDGLHPNAAGGLKMAKYLRAKLTEILEQY